MALVLTTQFPEKAPQLLVYQAMIVRAESNFEGIRWVSYDRRNRWEALATKILNWSVPNLRLYKEAFTGHARAVPRCSYCLQDGHMAQACPRNPSRPWFGYHHNVNDHTQHPPGTRNSPSQRCRRYYNEGKCQNSASSFWYLHKCMECGGLHPCSQCPRSGQGNYACSRSPAGQHSQLELPRHMPIPPVTCHSY